MEKCICSKEKEIEHLRNRIYEIEKKDIAKEKDMETFQKSLDELNANLVELKIMIQEINDKPLEKYEKAANVVFGGILGAITAFIMRAMLGGM